MSNHQTVYPSRYSFEARAMGAGLSFLVPGLGQIYQGATHKDSSRKWKGVFLLVSLLGMFFYGMWLSGGNNVYLPPFAQNKPVTLIGIRLNGLAGDLYTRLQYVGQFWIGVAAWPAWWHYYMPDSKLFGNFQRIPRIGQTLEQAEAELNEMQLDPVMGKRWDIAWVYTVIAGVLNILVIYDAWAGPVFARREPSPEPQPQGATA